MKGQPFIAWQEYYIIKVKEHYDIQSMVRNTRIERIKEKEAAADQTV